MKYLLWLLKAAIFFTLFAFALNNRQVVSVNFFFGTVWQAPLVIVVLCTFACGLALGVLMMIPRWWKNRSAKQSQPVAASTFNDAGQVASAPQPTSAQLSGSPTHGL